MINVYKSLPEIYYNQSRDFQAIARVHEVLYNYLKTNTDVMESLVFNNNFDSRLLDLMALTIGFISKHNYNTEDLYGLCASFADILRDKGSLRAINKAIALLLSAQNIDKEFKVSREIDDEYDLNIYIPTELTDLVLLEDLFDYILPSGFTYSFVRTSILDDIEAVKLTSSDSVVSNSYSSEQVGRVTSYDANDAVPFVEAENQSDHRPANLTMVGSTIHSHTNGGQ